MKTDGKFENVGNAGANVCIGRREFIAGTLAAAFAGRTVNAGETKRLDGECNPVPTGRLIVSAPVLQNAAETSMGVSFAVSADASGWVEYSESPDMFGAKRVYSGGRGLMTVDDKVALVRLTGLKSATRYYYRIGADSIDFRGGYKMKNLGPEVDSSCHSFTTLGAAASGSFCVINDTHDRKPALDCIFRKIRKLRPSVVIWNGDASNVTETIDEAIGIFIRPHKNHPCYAADTPYIFLNGNHDFRGRFNRRLGDLMMYRESTERAPEFAELGRNFVQRLGDIALIGLDTGEDKQDENPAFAGIFRMREYRSLQARWLESAVKSPTVTEARFKVAFCHIPLYDLRPYENPGDVTPDDSDPRYSHPWASWLRSCAKLWGPILEKAGVQLLVTAHQHNYRKDMPGPGRPWIQIIGGGHETSSQRASRHPTVIEGRLENGRLAIRIHDALRDKLIDSFTL